MALRRGGPGATFLPINSAANWYQESILDVGTFYQENRPAWEVAEDRDRALYQRPFNYLWDPFIDHADPNLPTKSSSGMTKFRYVPWLTEVDAGFWIALSNLKINIDQLEEPTRKLIAMYDLRPIAKPANSCNMMIKPGSFSSTGVSVRGAIRCEGSIKNFNTLDAFLAADKATMMRTAGKQIWDAIIDGTIFSIPSLLSSFYIASYADLKTHKFNASFAFPALHGDWNDEVTVTRPFGTKESEESEQLVDKVGTWTRSQNDERQHGFFLAKKIHTDENTALEEESESNVPSSSSSSNVPLSNVPSSPSVGIGYEWKIGCLGDFETGFFNGVAEEDQFVCFVDPSTYAEAASWPLRNLLALVRYRYKLRSVQILCYRDIHPNRHEARSIVVKYTLPSSALTPDNALSPQPTMPLVTGWNRTKGSLKPMEVDLAAFMDPKSLAKQSVDLNNKLMKWRVAPNLDLDVIKGTKCLLLGAGTLGSHVAINLLAWGVNKITFVDNGRVSYSNPVRQPLFAFNDCKDGGVDKAKRAAVRLQEIYPCVESAGYKVTVPMLGHPMTDERKTKFDFDTLKNLIDEHDAIFLLTDTRESRWLPTVMGKASGKIVLNAALGFDTFLVMRHGVSGADGSEAALGCYFCNDVVAPENSRKGATLDQQCTVTRPGAAPIASALASELLVSILQHPLQAHAPAPAMASQQSSSHSVSYDRDPPDHALGLVPHQIRGFLADFKNMVIKGQSYDCCSACSPKIVDAYKQDGFNFVKRALQESDYVEELSGLAEVKRKALEVEIPEWSSAEEDDEEAVML